MRCSHGFARTRCTSGTKAYSSCAKTEYVKTNYEDKALRPSLPDSGMRRG
jgi:hypothetical protein